MSMNRDNEPSKRPQQVAELIHKTLALALQRETNDPRLTKISITEVNVSPDLRNARVYYTLLDKNELKGIEKALAKGTGFLRHCVAQQVGLRYVPKLEFLYDDNLQHAEELGNLLAQIKVSDEPVEHKSEEAE